MTLPLSPVRFAGPPPPRFPKPVVVVTTPVELRLPDPAVEEVVARFRDEVSRERDLVASLAREETVWAALVEEAADDPRPGQLAQEARTMLARARRLMWFYNMTLEDYYRLLARQNGCCALCEGPPDEDKWFSVDHDHSCCPGKRSCGRCVRELLCTGCNWMVGRVETSRVSGGQVDAYLARHSR